MSSAALTSPHPVHPTLLTFRVMAIKKALYTQREYQQLYQSVTPTGGASDAAAPRWQAVLHAAIRPSSCAAATSTSISSGALSAGRAAHHYHQQLDGMASWPRGPLQGGPPAAAYAYGSTAPDGARTSQINVMHPQAHQLLVESCGTMDLCANRNMLASLAAAEQIGRAHV